MLEAVASTANQTEADETRGAGAANCPPNEIPSELWEKLVGLRPIVERQGYLGQRNEKWRRPMWQLRYRMEDPDSGRRRNHSLNLGLDDEVAAAVQDVLEGWQQEYRDSKRKREQRERAVRVLSQRTRLSAYKLGATRGEAEIAANAVKQVFAEYNCYPLSV